MFSNFGTAPISSRLAMVSRAFDVKPTEILAIYILSFRRKTVHYGDHRRTVQRFCKVCSKLLSNIVPEQSQLLDFFSRYQMR